MIRICIKRACKKILLIYLVSLIIGMVIICTGVNTVYAEEDKTADDVTGDVTGDALDSEGVLPLQRMYEIAVNNSIQVQIDDMNILIKEDALKQAKENAAFLGDAFGPIQVLNNRIIKEVKPFEAEVDVEQAKKTREENIKNLKLNIHKSIQTLLLAEKEFEMETLKLNLMFERYDLLKIKKQQGAISESSLVDVEFGIEGKRMDIVRVEEKIETIKNDIKRLIGLPFSEDLPEIDAYISYEPLVNINLDKALKSCYENSITVFKQTKDIEALEKTLELTGLYFSTSNMTYINSKYALEKAKAALEETKLSLEVAVRNSYSNLLNQRDRVRLAEKYLELMQKKLKEAELKYNNGFTTKDVVLNAKEALISAEYQLYSAIYNYSIMKADFERLVGMW